MVLSGVAGKGPLVVLVLPVLELSFHGLGVPRLGWPVWQYTYSFPLVCLYFLEYCCHNGKSWKSIEF